MNDKRDRPARKATNDSDFSAVETAWRDLPREAPPELLDRAVLNRARRDLETTRPRRLRWIGHFATAGVVVIAVSMWVLQDGGDLSAPGDGTLRLEPAADAGPPAELHSRRVIRETAPPPQARMEPKGAPANTRAARLEESAVAPADTSPMAEASDEDTAPRDPDAWIEELLELEAQGRGAELKAGLEAFRAAWPDYPLPTALQDR